MDYFLLIVYSILIVLFSALGGTLPRFFRFTHRRIQFTLSFVSGVMLGVAFLHLLPHSIAMLNYNLQQSMLAALCGLLVMFLLIRTFHFHQHDMAADDGHEHSEGCTHLHESHGSAQGKLPHTEHSHTLPIILNESDVGVPAENAIVAHSRDLSWIGLTVGLALHTLIDGLALAAAYSAERSHNGLAGLGTFLAIVLHKPLDALTITSLMSARRASQNQQMAVNLVFALMCPLGAILFAFSFSHLEDYRNWTVGVTLAFSAGVFLCISLGDLLPEVHFHSHDRVWLSLVLLLGVLIAYMIEYLMGHQHAIPALPV